MMGKKKLWGGLIAGFLVVALGTMVIFGQMVTESGTEGRSIAVIHVEGTIVGDRGGGYFSAAADAPSLMEKIRMAKDDPEVRAVVFRINSPGGSAAASQEIAREIGRLKDTGKVVVASMGDAAASGGYWIAVLADKIMANPATMTGSIGVIMQTPNLEEFYDMLGIDYHTFKSGPHKDMGSANRPLTEEEKAIFQGMIDNIYEQFVDVVAEGRSMTREEVLRVADGRVFTGSQAKELGLIDELGNYYDALTMAQELAGIEGEPKIKTYEVRRSVFFNLLNIRSLLSSWSYLQPAGLNTYRVW